MLSDLKAARSPTIKITEKEENPLPPVPIVKTFNKHIYPITLMYLIIHSPDLHVKPTYI